MIKNQIVAITGPTGSGKSTVAGELAKRFDSSVNIDVDKIKHLIVNGFKYDDSEIGYNQWILLGKNIGLLAANFIENGYKVIINGYLEVESWREISKYVQITDYFLILPDVEKNLIRDSGRHPDSVMGADAVHEHQDYFKTDDFYKTFKQIDNSDHSISETVDNIINQLT
jgi:cytidylate kinase